MWCLLNTKKEGSPLLSGNQRIEKPSTHKLCIFPLICSTGVDKKFTLQNKKIEYKNKIKNKIK
jgi:hypothetical protein